MLEIQQLSLGRGGRLLQRDLTFSLASGSALQLLGPNGVGKSSLLHSVVGLLEAESGRVLWQQQDIMADRDEWHRGLFFLPHRLPAHPLLTPLEVLRDSLALKAVKVSAQQIEEALLAVDLLDQAEQACGSLSAGQQRRVWLARLVLSLRLMPAETLWLLDEPLTSLDKQAQALVFDLLQQHLSRGGLLLLTSHQPVDLPKLQTLTLELAS